MEKCRLCEHTFDLFNDYDKYYHYLRHYKDLYKSKQVKDVVKKGLTTDGKSSNCNFCQDELFNFNNLGRQGRNDNMHMNSKTFEKSVLFEE